MNRPTYPTKTLAILACALLAMTTAHTSAITITFEEAIPSTQHAHGQIINTQYNSPTYLDLTISADNFRGSGPDIAAVFNSSLSSTADPDLEGPPGRLWAGGNIPTGEILGRMLIIAEHPDTNNDDIVDPSDDEGRSPAGELIFDFGTPIIEFGFDVIDVEPGEKRKAFVASFFLGNSPNAIGTINFEDFETRDGAVFGGDNYANRIAPIRSEDLVDINSNPVAADLEFDRIVITMGGSGAVDNLVFSESPPDGGGIIPLPTGASIGVTGFALLAFISYGRRQQRQTQLIPAN